jgi:Ethanolamine utilization protein EutJ (predicted chaperonin)
LDVLRWSVENGCPFDRAACVAAAHGDRATVEHLNSVEGSGIDVYVYVDDPPPAADVLACLDWLKSLA